MFKSRKRRRRRSEMRLGAEAISYEYESVKTGSAFSLTPVFRFWQVKGPKISGLAMLALLGWAFYSIFTSPAFFVYGAEITGTVALSGQEIYNAGGIDRQSVFWLNPAEVSRQVTALPNIKSAEVSITLPAKVSIEVVERRPQLLWQTGESIWWVDEEGTVVPPKTDVEDMLKIIDDDLQPVEADFQIDHAIIKGAQALRLLAPNVSIIRHTRAQGLIVATPEGWPVYLGNGSDIRAKLVVLGSLLPLLREKETPPTYIDLRNPLRPVYKLVPTPAPPPQQRSPAAPARPPFQPGIPRP